MTDTDERRRSSLGKPAGGTTRPSEKRAMTPEIQNRIGQQLRAYYSGIVDQGVPDRFARLIDELDEQTKKNNKEQD